MTIFAEIVLFLCFHRRRILLIIFFGHINTISLNIYNFNHTFYHVSITLSVLDRTLEVLVLTVTNRHQIMSFEDLFSPKLSFLIVLQQFGKARLK